MAIAYLDTQSGIAGDMLLAALVDAGADADYIKSQLKTIGLPGEVELEFSHTHRHDFRALRLDVRFPMEHAHRHLQDIEGMIVRSKLTGRERELSLRIFGRLAEAEAKVHGTTVDKVHFHEVGAVDSIVDIVGVAIAISQLNIQRIIASPTPMGCGSIMIAHGRVSVPAPATAELMLGLPIRESRIEAELTTPTGAAVLATLVDEFGPLPAMRIGSIGYGAGHRDLKEQANVLRVILGDSDGQNREQVFLIECNLDDITGEQLGFAQEMLWDAGALDVFTTPIQMKKGRPAIKLSVLCNSQKRHELQNVMFTHTGSLGLRLQILDRVVLNRQSQVVETPLGQVRVKYSWTPSAQMMAKPEFEDCKRLALQHRVSLAEIYELVKEHARRVAPPPPSPRPNEIRDHDHHHDHHHDHRSRD